MMPNRAWPGRSPKASRERAAHRIDSRIEAATVASSAGSAGHSSKHITMSDPRSRWISMLRSGVSMCFDPSRCEENRTPSSVSFRNCDSDITWNPPESVRIGCGQFMNLCRPPSRATRSAPGRSIR